MIRMIFEALFLLLLFLLQVGGVVLRWLPFILKAIWYLAQLGLRLSFVAYQFLLTRVQSLVARLGVDLLINPWRTGICVLLSVSIGMLVLMLAGWSITPPALVAIAMHGLVVGYIWDQLGPPTGLGLGV